ncbi:MAG TPA: lipopolysaccharide kinase InaA family protein [Gemmataceae bacterium]|jgi:heptose I phosphotransferase|nr:lipopolysaccharide kinase InaA family protein [Gemmataceae bacterium]
MSASADRTGSLAHRWTQGFQRIRQTDDWAEFAGPDWLDRIMTVEVTDRLFRKQGRSIARWTLTAADGRQLVVYLKRHFELPRKHGLMAVLFPGKARSPGLQEWEHLKWAEVHGLPVPRALAAGELVGPHGRLQSFIAIAELTDMLPLHEAVPLAERSLDGETFRRWKQTLSDELVRLSVGFHDRRAFHKDWYFCHFYIDQTDTRCVPPQWVGRVRVIDLHRMAHHRLTGLWRKAKDLAQLLYSSDVPGVTDEDRRGFWAGYRRHTRLPWLVALLARMKWRLYRRHNAPKG